MISHRTSDELNFIEQASHSNGLIPSWMVRMCFFRELPLVNDDWHISQTCGFNPECDLKWESKLAGILREPFLESVGEQPTAIETNLCMRIFQDKGGKRIPSDSNDVLHADEDSKGC